MNNKDMSTIINFFLWAFVMSVDAGMTFLPRRHTRIHLPCRPMQPDINLHNTYIAILRGGHSGEDTSVEKDTTEDNDNKGEDEAWSEEIRRTRAFYNTPRFSKSKDILIAGSSVTSTPSKEENVVVEDERVFGNALTQQLDEVDNDAKRSHDSEIKESEASSEVILEEGGDIESDGEAEGDISIQHDSESTSEIMSQDDHVMNEEEETDVELEDTTKAINEEAVQLMEKEYNPMSDTVDVEEDTTSDIVESEETDIVDKEDDVHTTTESVSANESSEEVDVAQEEKADKSLVIDEVVLSSNHSIELPGVHLEEDPADIDLAVSVGGNKSLKESIACLCNRLLQKVSTSLYVAPAAAVSIGVILTLIFSPTSLGKKLMIFKRDEALGIEDMQAIDLSDDADDEDIDGTNL